MEPTSSNFHEILSCRGAIPSLHAEALVDAQGQIVQRLSSSDIVPARAVDIAQTAAACISMRCGIAREHLRVSVQTTNASAPFLGRVHGGAVVLLDHRAVLKTPSVLGAAIRCAGQFANLLADRPAAAPSVTSCANGSDQTEPPLTMDDLAGSAVLGAKLRDTLDIVIPGSQPVRLSNRLRRAKPKDASVRTRTIRARLRAVMVGGRGHRMFVRGTDVATNEAFGNHPIAFAEQWRQQVSDALATPGGQLLLSISEETFDDGTARKRVKRILMGLTMHKTTAEAANQVNPQAHSIVAVA